MVKRETTGWVKGAFLLTLAGLIGKVLSAGYRIPLQNLTGDIGFYIYQQVYPLLGMALILALYGFPAAISKLTADTKANGQMLSFRSFYLPIFTILSVVIGLITIFLFIFADKLAIIVGDIELTRAYQLVALSLLVIPFTSLLRGTFQGQFEMKPTAYSQMGEQLIRVLIIIFLAIYVSTTDASLYLIGEGAAVASLIAGIAAIIILALFVKKSPRPSTIKHSIPWKNYIGTVVVFGLIASLNHMVLLLLQLADTFTLLPALMESGLSKVEAMEAKGVLDRGQPLIQLGTVLGSSFALAMIPTLSKKRLKENTEDFYEKIRSGIAIGFYLAVGATVGLIMIMPEANLLLFQDTKGTSDLRILVLAILLSALVITVATILQGLGYVKRTAAFILITLGIKWLSNLLLVPILGITGSAFATVLSLLVLLILVSAELKRKLPNLALVKQVNWRSLLFATGGMMLFIFFVDFFMPSELSRGEAFIYVLFVASIGAIIYLLLLLRSRVFTKEEISMLPLARIWISIARVKKK
ncbi:putative polysaccharide biosynthesis protein [Oceanobacillus sp. CAU 1775]